MLRPLEVNDIPSTASPSPHASSFRFILVKRSLGRRKPGILLRSGIVRMRGQWTNDHGMRLHEYPPSVCLLLQAGTDAMQTAEDREKAKAREESSAPPLKPTAAVTAAAVSDGVPRDVQRRLAIRTRFCDDFFEDCAGPRGIKQCASLRLVFS
ncbi:unnamed protein product [Ectocarpus sp. 12 AP-2014]